MFSGVSRYLHTYVALYRHIHISTSLFVPVVSVYQHFGGCSSSVPEGRCTELFRCFWEVSQRFYVGAAVTLSGSRFHLWPPPATGKARSSRRSLHQPPGTASKTGILAVHPSVLCPAGCLLFVCFARGGLSVQMFSLFFAGK